MRYAKTIAARRARRDRRRLALPLLAGAVAIGAVGCGDLLDVRDPDIVTPEDLSGAPGLATLRAGAFETFHTDLRATVGLGSVDVSMMTQTEMEDFHFAERAFWLWGTAHRLGDLRRLVRQYGRGSESVFPTGPYFKAGSTYGTDMNLPVPIEEQNNPNFSGCIDRNA
jgi:hypothetical protein